METYTVTPATITSFPPLLSPYNMATIVSAHKDHLRARAREVVEGHLLQHIHESYLTCRGGVTLTDELMEKVKHPYKNFVSAKFFSIKRSLMIKAEGYDCFVPTPRFLLRNGGAILMSLNEGLGNKFRVASSWEGENIVLHLEFWPDRWDKDDEEEVIELPVQPPSPIPRKSSVESE